MASKQEPRWTVLEVKRDPEPDPQIPQAIEFGRVVVVPGLHWLADGSAYVMDGDDSILFNPRTAETTRVDTSTEK